MLHLLVKRSTFCGKKPSNRDFLDQKRPKSINTPVRCLLMIIMYHINLSGTFYEMGTFYGKILKDSGFKLPIFRNKEIKFALKCKDHVETVFPGYVEELRGIADTAGLNFEGLCTLALKIPDLMPSCSIFAVTDRTQTFLGRNYDMYYSLDHLESYFTAPHGNFKSVGQTDIFVGREDGVNEKGLGVAMSGITAYFEPGIAFWVAVRYLLDKCATVQEGIDFLTDLPHYCTMTFLLADPTGDMVVIEASPKQIAVREPKNDYIVSTNHLNHPKMQKLEIFEPPDSRIRYETIIKTLSNRKGKLDEEYIQSILSNHKGLVCSHIEEIRLGTLWSMVANLNTRQIWRAEGHPCSNPYIRDNRLISLCNLKLKDSKFF